MTVWTQLVPIGGYRPTAFKDLHSWVTDRYDVRLYADLKIIQQESFSSFDAARRYCDWLDRGVTYAGNISTKAGTP